MKKILFLSMIVILNSCASEFENRSGNTSKLDQDRRYCKAAARAAAPIYLCRNPLMCAPDETSRVIQSISSHNGYYDKCMFEQGNTVK
jgi:hypothetical protein